MNRQTIASVAEWLRYGFVIASLMLLVLIWISYWQRYDLVAAITIYPIWCWVGLGILLIVIGLTQRNRKLCAIATALWALCLIVFADSPMSIVRTLVPYQRDKHSLRVVSLNCASNSLAARAVATLEPDIVLFQESPSQDELDTIAADLYGDVGNACWGADASILARGSVSRVDIPIEHRENFVHARVRIDCKEFDVISLRLFPCPIRLDLWSPRCWAVYCENRVKRKRQLRVVAEYTATLPTNGLLILGGDFNAPANDAVFRLLQPTLVDTFAEAGRGWGCTFMDELPVVRIDQIWCSRRIQPIVAFAKRSVHSDHRMSVADLRFAESD